LSLGRPLLAAACRIIIKLEVIIKPVYALLGVKKALYEFTVLKHEIHPLDYKDDIFKNIQ
jgi:hypothetical protein